MNHILKWVLFSDEKKSGYFGNLWLKKRVCKQNEIKENYEQYNSFLSLIIDKKVYPFLV
jgi:hypothetical protein